MPDNITQIFELKSENPELFQKGGIKVCIYFNYYDKSCIFNTPLPVLRREFEKIRFSFVKGKVGTDCFWLKKVAHEIVEDNATIFLSLESGIFNRNREFVFDKALFHARIHFMDLFQKKSYEIDKELKILYRT